MKLAIKNKNTFRYVDSKDIEVNGVTLGDLFLQQHLIIEEFHALLDELKNSYVVKKDTAYIIDVDGTLHKIDNLNLVEIQDTKFPLSFYEMVDGKIQLNKKKVGAL